MALQGVDKITDSLDDPVYDPAKVNDDVRCLMFSVFVSVFMRMDFSRDLSCVTTLSKLCH